MSEKEHNESKRVEDSVENSPVDENDTRTKDDNAQDELPDTADGNEQDDAVVDDDVQALSDDDEESSLELSASDSPQEQEGFEISEADRLMAEQMMSDGINETSDGGATSAPSNLGQALFQPLGHSQSLDSHDLDVISEVPIELSVELGRTRMTIKNLLQMGRGAVIELNEEAGSPMDIYVNGYLIAQGEVVVVGDQYGIRVTDIITASERLARLATRS